MSKQRVSPICTYAELHHAFRHSQKGAGFLKMAFLPEQVSKTSWLLRIVVATFFGLSACTFMTTSAWPLVVAFILEGPFILLAQREVQRGVRLAMPRNSAVHNLDKQPWKLRRAVIRYAYFIDRLQKLGEQPSLAQLSSALQLIEINRTGRPPTWTGLLRHPLVVATVVGVFLYSFNTKIVGPPSTGADWNHFWMVLLGLLVFLSAASIVYQIRYLGPDEEWQFECGLRWYQLELQNQSSPTRCGAIRAAAKKN
jgi:hypothetical protein